MSFLCCSRSKLVKICSGCALTQYRVTEHTTSVIITSTTYKFEISFYSTGCCISIRLKSFRNKQTKENMLCNRYSYCYIFFVKYFLFLIVVTSKINYAAIDSALFNFLHLKFHSLRTAGCLDLAAILVQQIKAVNHSSTPSKRKKAF